MVDYSTERSTITLKVDFLDAERLQVLEDIFTDKKLISFWLAKPFRRMKTHPQLKKYYKNLHIILSNVLKTSRVDSNTVRAFDEEIKKSSMPCKMIEIFDKIIPLVPSKKDMTVGELSYLIEVIEERYKDILDKGEYVSGN